MGRGGARTGAGRPKGLGKHGGPTKPVRIPIALIDEVEEFMANKGYKIPFYGSAVQAGFPSPADDYIENEINLNDHLIRNPPATFLVRAKGDSMINSGIFDGDTMVVDRSLDPSHGKIVIAVVDGELTVKRLHKTAQELLLLPENDDFSPIVVGELNEFMIWGVVTNVIHPV